MRAGWRSLLFVSSDDPKKLARVHMRGADAVILDLEDAVPADRKPFARAALAETITSLAARGVTVIVRVNADWLNLIEDLRVSVMAGVTAIMLPKIDAAWRVRAISEFMTELEHRAGLDMFQVGIVALIEDAQGLAALDNIARQDRFLGFALGSEDFALSMGVAPTPQLLDYPCKLIALAAARHGVAAWAMPLSISIFDDADAIESALISASRYGIEGALCIHPNQVAAANRIFAASPEQIAEARSIIEAWDSNGGSGVTSLNGRMIDRPVAERARHLLARD
jgi:citrate lyase subunit beta/citryl-CoA lyase